MSTPVAMTNHIADETLAAFIDGRADPETRQRVIDHMANCTDCYSIWESAADYAALGAEEAPAAPREPNVTQGEFGQKKKPWPGWWGVAAAIIVALIGVASFRDRLFGGGGDMDSLIRASEAQRHRSIAGRLSGDFPHRDFRTMRGPGDDDALDPDQWLIAQAVGEAEQRAAEHRSIDHLHVLAVSYLVAKEPRKAVPVIEEALRAATGTSDMPEAIHRSQDADLLNDASAAYYARATAGGAANQQQEDYHLALEAADYARRLANTPQSLWNRALALEALGNDQEARSAWQDYLKADSASEWAAEAQRRLTDLSDTAGARAEVPPSEQLRDALAAANEQAVRTIVQNHRAEARVFAEEHLLPEWGSATLRSARSDELTQLLLLAQVLKEVTGDRLIFDSVAVIRAASPSERMELAAAHVDFGEARVHSLNGPTKALDQFRRAATRMEAAGSPFAALARVRQAGCLERTAAYDAALRMLEVSVPSSETLEQHGYLALAAQIEWTRALVLVDIGIPDAGLTAYERALVWFVRLQERPNEANVRIRAAQAAEMLGDGDAALAHRLEALRLGSEASAALNQHTLLVEAARALSRRNLVSSADVLFDRLVEIGRRSNAASDLCTAFLWRSLHRAEHGNRPDALHDLDAAEPACDRIADKPLRARIRDIQAYVAAVMENDQHVVVARLDEAIAFSQSTGSRFGTAMLYSRRAKAHLATHDLSAAQADARAALLQIDEQLTEVAQPEFRDSMVESVREIVARRIEVELAAGDTDAAFAAAEWQRNHLGGLGEAPASAPESLADVRRSLAADATVLAFHVGPQQLTVFVISRTAAEARIVAISALHLRRGVDDLRSAIRRDDEPGMNSRTSRLYAIVVAPVEQLLRDTRVLLVVPDGALAGVPFAILRDGEGRRLVERFTVAYLPSAAALVQRPDCGAIGHASHAVLLAGAPRKGDDAGALMEADREVNDLARLYNNREVLREDRATPDEFLAAIVRAAVIHYAGHAVTNAKQPMRSALLLSPESNGATPRYLYASQIAATKLRGCRLVVLAGCATGKRDGASRTVGSLAQAFLIAGAEAVVGTLWDVDDRVSRYTSRRIHELVLGGASSADAVRTVQLEMMKSTEPELRTVSAWASLTVLGGCDGSTSTTVRS